MFHLAQKDPFSCNVVEQTANALLKIKSMSPKTSLLLSFIFFLEELYHTCITCYDQPSQKALTLPEQLLKVP